MRLPARWRWSAKCECGRMVLALRWKLHRLRPGHQVMLINMDLFPGRRTGKLTSSDTRRSEEGE